MAPDHQPSTSRAAAPGDLATTDVVVIGGGQAGLACSFYLRRAGVEHVVLDAEPAPGGAWQHTWPSLRLFSPAAYSSLPGRQMPPTRGDNPDAGHVIDYLTSYEERYEVPVVRPVTVESVERDGDGFVVRTDVGDQRCRAVLSATGSWSRPFVPTYPGARDYAGEQVHSSRYEGPERYAGRRVVVVGGANSGAQVATDLVEHADVTWCTLGDPRYLPDDVDGRELFRVASARVRGLSQESVGSLGDIVSVPPVRKARDAGLLRATPMFDRFTPDGVAWANDREDRVDVVIWCTGFRPALSHLRPLGLPRDGGRVVTVDSGPAVDGVPGLWLVGYGDWCGAASATLIGVGQWAKRAVAEVVDLLG